MSGVTSNFSDVKCKIKSEKMLDYRAWHQDCSLYYGHWAWIIFKLQENVIKDLSNNAISLEGIIYSCCVDEWDAFLENCDLNRKVIHWKMDGCLTNKNTLVSVWWTHKDYWINPEKDAPGGKEQMTDNFDNCFGGWFWCLNILTTIIAA